MKNSVSPGRISNMVSAQRVRTVTVALVILAAAVVASPQQKSVRKPVAPTTPVAPFRVSENLLYSGQWLSLKDVISARLTVTDERAFAAHAAWHFQARLETKNPLRYVLAVNDNFDSYAGHTDLAGLQFEMHLNEGTKSENHVLRMTPSQTPVASGTTPVSVLPGTRDALAFLYYLRTVNWQTTHEVRSPVFDGRKVYDVRATVVTPHSDLTLIAGKFAATGLSVRPFLNGKELADTRITLWLAQDAACTPVLIDLELPIGSGRVELTQTNPAK